MKETVPVESETLEVSSITDGDNFMVPDVTVSGELHIQDPHEQLASSKSIPDQSDTVDENFMSQKFCQNLSLDSKMEKCLNKCATFPLSKEVQLNAQFSEGREESSRVFQGQCSSASETSAYVRSMSLPASLNIVSAMKGGRARNGTSPKMELRVKWDPEVYDPPATSLSHTLKSHQQRPKSKRKDNNSKHKHKGKSSRGNFVEKRHPNRKTISNLPDPKGARLQANADMLPLGAYGNSKVEVLEYGVGSQEEKCGTSFLRETLPKVHLPVGEAS